MLTRHSIDKLKIKSKRQTKNTTDRLDNQMFLFDNTSKNRIDNCMTKNHQNHKSDRSFNGMKNSIDGSKRNTAKTQSNENYKFNHLNVSSFKNNQPFTRNFRDAENNSRKSTTKSSYLSENPTNPPKRQKLDNRITNNKKMNGQIANDQIIKNIQATYNQRVNQMKFKDLNKKNLNSTDNQLFQKSFASQKINISANNQSASNHINNYKIAKLGNRTTTDNCVKNTRKEESDKKQDQNKNRGEKYSNKKHKRQRYKNTSFKKNYPTRSKKNRNLNENHSKNDQIKKNRRIGDNMKSHVIHNWVRKNPIIGKIQKKDANSNHQEVENQIFEKESKNDQIINNKTVQNQTLDQDTSDVKITSNQINKNQFVNYKIIDDPINSQTAEDQNIELQFFKDQEVNILNVTDQEFNNDDNKIITASNDFYTEESGCDKEASYFDSSTNNDLNADSQAINNICAIPITNDSTIENDPFVNRRSSFSAESQTTSNKLKTSKAKKSTCRIFSRRKRRFKATLPIRYKKLRTYYNYNYFATFACSNMGSEDLLYLFSKADTSLENELINCEQKLANLTYLIDAKLVDQQNTENNANLINKLNFCNNNDTICSNAEQDCAIDSNQQNHQLINKSFCGLAIDFNDFFEELKINFDPTVIIKSILKKN